MSEVVFVLGAGASVEAGAPTMKGFLDAAEAISTHEAAGNDEFALVFKAVPELHAAQAKSGIDVHDIEAVFTAFEMAQLLGRLGSLTADELASLRRAMKYVISRTLEERVTFGRRDGRLVLHETYQKFGEFLTGLVRRRSVSIITFNYDVYLDCMLHVWGIPFVYGLERRRTDGAITLAKLHGSLGWGFCPTCKEIKPLPGGWFDSAVPAEPADNTVRLRIASAIWSSKHCGVQQEPCVVPPTWNKMQHGAQLGRVWKAAAEELASAEYIYVCGYSLPTTDQFFQQLYALGTVGSARLKAFEVFDPDAGVGERFDGVLGPQARSRFKHHRVSFRELPSHIRVT